MDVHTCLDRASTAGPPSPFVRSDSVSRARVPIDGNREEPDELE